MLIEKAVNDIDSDIVFWTGDIVPHDIWNQKLDHVMFYQREITEALKTNFTSQQIYPLMGNHDFANLNSHDLSVPYSDWALLHTAELWTEGDDPLIFEKEEAELFEQYSYYSLPLKTKKDKKMSQNGRIIVINTEAGYLHNLLLYKTRQDPGGQLAWLESLLTKMEADGEFAIILGHVPSSKEDFSSNWALRLRALMDRF